MNYTKEAIEKRRYRANLVKAIGTKFIYIFAIVLIYNTVLITKSSLDNNASKEIFGYKAYIITTESMKPTIKIGDVIIVENVEEDKLKEGDVITLKKSGEIITHRIATIQEPVGDTKSRYITKGDNNNIEDQEITEYDDIEGRKVIIIPFLGKMIMFLRNGLYGILSVVVILMICIYAIKEQKKRKKRRDKKKFEDEKHKKENNENIEDNP